MEKNKSAFNVFRDALQQGIYKVINPFVKLLIKIGVTPNVVTTIGLLGNVAATVLFVIAAFRTWEQGSPTWGLVTIAGAVIILFSLFDMLDGQVARIGGMVSKFGALYDSVLDRYCELLTLGGIALFLLAAGSPVGALLSFLALVGSVMVSYVRARAEGLDIECKVGFMQRPERVVVTSLSALAAGIVGEAGHSETAVIILLCAMALIALLANLTAFARLRHCAKALKQ